MATTTTSAVAKLVERLGELCEEDQDVYATHFLSLIEQDDDFDRLIARHPEALDDVLEEARAEIAAGLTLPLTEADFGLEDH